MAFTHDATTDRGKVRLLVYDTTETGAAFTDAEIDALLELNSDSIWYAAADACRSLAAKNAPKAFYLRVAGALDIDKKQVSKRFISLAYRYEQRAVGSSDGIAEYIDSYDIGTSPVGQDTSEYVED